LSAEDTLRMSYREIAKALDPEHVGEFLFGPAEMDDDGDFLVDQRLEEDLRAELARAPLPPHPVCLTLPPGWRG
jgi:hypothetical protein